MSEKEVKDYFKKLMNDTQNKIDDVNNEKSINEDVKIDNNEHNEEQLNSCIQQVHVDLDIEN